MSTLKIKLVLPRNSAIKLLSFCFIIAFVLINIHCSYKPKKVTTSYISKYIYYII